MSDVLAQCHGLLSYTEASACHKGFLSSVTGCIGCGTGGESAATRLIPDKHFTCHGAVVGWRAAGILSDNSSLPNNNAMLGIWRESSTGTYNKIATIELGTCGSGVEAPIVAGESNVYECSLPENLRVTVQPGDILGIDIGAASGGHGFRLVFINGGPTNYVFNGHPSTATLSQSDSIVQERPQVILTAVTVATSTVELPEKASTPRVTTTSFTSDADDVLLTTDGVSVALVAGAVGGSVFIVFILLMLTTLTLALVHMTRKYKNVKKSVKVGTSLKTSRNEEKLTTELEVNALYNMSVDRSFITEDNAAYGQCNGVDDKDMMKNIVYNSTTRQTASPDASNDCEMKMDEDPQYEYISE